MTKFLVGLLMLAVGAGCGGYSSTGNDRESTKKELLVWTQTDSDGSVEEEYQYYLDPGNNERIQEGWYNSYYSNGNYEWVGIHKQDKRDGKWSKYYLDGTLWQEMNYVDGKLEGKETLYQAGGKIYEKYWVNDALEKWLYFRPENENAVHEVNFVNGKQEGKTYWFFDNGDVEYEVNFVNGKQEGDGIHYNEDGTVRQFTHSELIVTRWKIEGQLVWTFKRNGTVVFDGMEEYNFSWEIEGDRLTITDVDTGEVFSEYDIESLSMSELVIVDPEYPDNETRYVR